MSKPKVIWEWVDGGSCTIAYCNYDGVRLALDHEYRPTEKEKKEGKKDKFRIRLLRPKHAELGSQVVFHTKKIVRQVMEQEARRIAEGKPAIDYRLQAVDRQKAQRYEELTRICEAMGRTPEQAVYELAGLYELSENRKPVELVTLYLEEFERVKQKILLAELVEKRIKRIEKDRKAKTTKRWEKHILKHFRDSMGGHRFMHEVSVEEMQDWCDDLPLDAKTIYDYWLVMRDLVRMAFNNYGAISRWVYDQVEEIDYSAKSNSLTILLPFPLYQQLFARCGYINDALYLKILSSIPLRRAELLRLDWSHIERWPDGRPRIFHIPAKLAKGQEGFQEERFIDITPSLGDVLLAFWQDSGPIIVGNGHQQRLAALAKSIDPNFNWPHNVLRRTCISVGVADTQDKAYFQYQAGHDAEAQNRYLRPVDPLLAKEQRAYLPDIARLKKLPPFATPKKLGRPAQVEGAETATGPTCLVDSQHDSVSEVLASESEASNGLLEVPITDNQPVPDAFLRASAGNGHPMPCETPNPSSGTAVPGKPELEDLRQKEHQPAAAVVAEIPIPEDPIEVPPVRKPTNRSDSAKPKNISRRVSKVEPWSLQGRFLHLLWTLEIAAIARLYQCQANGIVFHAVTLGFQLPPEDYWKSAQHEIPVAVKNLILKLEADEAERASQIPLPPGFSFPPLTLSRHDLAAVVSA